MSVNYVSTPRCHWLIVHRADGPLRVLITEDTNTSRVGEVLPVFCFEEEARMFLELGALDEEVWRIRMVGPGELASLLCGLCHGVNLVALDPLPVVIGLKVEYPPGLLSRKNFVELLLRRAVNGPDTQRPTAGADRTRYQTL